MKPIAHAAFWAICTTITMGLTSAVAAPPPGDG